MVEQALFDHAVDHIEIEPAVVVQIAKLSCPTPTGRLHAAAGGLVAPTAIRLAHFQHIGRPLGVTRGVGLFQDGHHRQPGGQIGDGNVIGVHVGGKEGQLTVVGNVGPIAAHRAIGGFGERLARRPHRRIARSSLIEPELVAQMEIVADPEVRPAIFIEVRCRQPQALRLAGQPHRDKATGPVCIDGDAAATRQQKVVPHLAEDGGVIGGGGQI